MNSIWKVLTTDDNREFIATLYKVDSLEAASAVLQQLMPIIVRHNAQRETSVTISDENISVVLHGHSRDPINDADWQLAKELEPYLTHEN